MLLDDPKKEATVQKGWRLPLSIAQYVQMRTKGAHRGAETELVVDALSLHRELYERLSEEGARLQRFAAENDLNFSADSAKVIAKLVLLGLEAAEKSKRK